MRPLVSFIIILLATITTCNSIAYTNKTCTYCNGTGLIKCSKCEGYGYLVPGYGVRGNGKLSGGNTICPECKGAKTTECPLKEEYPRLHSNKDKNDMNRPRKELMPPILITKVLKLTARLMPTGHMPT